MLLHLILPFLSVTENELSYLTLLARTDVGQAVSQPESIEYIKHTSCAAPVQNVNVHALVSLRMNVLK